MEVSETWLERFPGLAQLEPANKKILLEQSRIVELPADQTIFGAGTSPDNMLFLLDGTVRVQQTSENGREIVLYRINAGESCVMTTACLLAFDDYYAEGISETPIKAAALPRQVFDDLVANSKRFREFVFHAFSRRIVDLFKMVDEMAFQRVDVRLAHKLIDLAEGASEVSATHQKLAVELGTAREVISRQLQEFHRRGWIEQTRGLIKITDLPALSALSRTAA